MIMTTTAATSQMTEELDLGLTDPIRQWRGESIQLVNWGNMSGHVKLDLDGHSVLMTGESGAGKSTVLDAVLAIMQPSRTRFNSASNATSSGRARSGDQRDELSYLMGKLDDFERPDGETVSRSLRSVTKQPLWGALAMTFRSSLDEQFTLVRAYYVPRGASHRNEIRPRCATIDGPFDLRQLHEAAGTHFDKRAMRSLGLHPYDGPGSFHDAMCKKLGFGAGSGVVDLLRRIQSGADVPSVNELFAQTVLEEPATFEMAKSIADSFEGLRATYNEMKTVAEIIKVLSGIPEHKAELDAAAEELADLESLRLTDSGTTPFDVWCALTETKRREKALNEANDALPQAKSTAQRAGIAKEQATRQVRGIERALEDENAGLSELKDEVEQADADRNRIAERRARFDKAASALNEVVTTSGEYAALLSKGATLSEDISAQRGQLRELEVDLLGRKADLRRQEADLDREIASLQRRTSRLPEHLDTIRNQVASRLGWQPSELPFIAELIDVPEEHEQWRTAAEAVLGGVGTRLVVPPGQRGRFQHAINDMRLGTRIRFDFATTEAPFVDVHDSRRLISHLVFAPEFAFRPWLIDRVHRAGGRHLAVDTVHELGIADGESRVVRSGQVSERTSGSHGGGQTRLLGFTNDDLVADKKQTLSEVRQHLEDVERQLDHRDTQNRSLDQRMRYIDALEGFGDWSELDIGTATARLESARDRLDELRRTSDRIPMLEAQLKTALEAETAAARSWFDMQNVVERLQDEVVVHGDRIKSLARSVDKHARGEVALNDAQTALCDDEVARVGVADGVELLEETFSRVRQNLRERTAPLQQRKRRATNALENVFSSYRSRWGDEANDSVDVGAYDEYLQILKAQQARGLDEVRNDWCAKTISWSADDLLTLRLAFKDARDEIKTRIDSISDLLRTIPFGGADDRLQLQVKDRIPPGVQSWLRDLQELANNVTDLDAIIDPAERFRAIEARFGRIDALIDKIRLKPRNTSEDTTRNAILDVRRQVFIKAHRVSGQTGEIIATHTSFGSKSGGETQELTAFITGAALRFRLTSIDSTLTGYTPVFLDEGFIKADGKFTGRAVQAWEALGFQLIVAAPVDKFTAMEPYMKRLFMVSKDGTGRGYCDQLTADEIRDQLSLN